MSDLPKIETYWLIEIRDSELSRWHHYYSGTTEREIHRFLEVNEHIKTVPDECKRIVKATYKREVQNLPGRVQRLQAAVKEMLAELNAEAGEKLWGFDGYDGQDVMSIEDYGLTKEDME